MINITKRTALLSIIFLVLAIVLAVQAAAAPEIHTVPEGPFVVNEGDLLEMDVVFSGIIGSIKEFEYSLYDASGSLLQGGGRSWSPGGGGGGGTPPNEVLPLFWTSSSSETGEPIETFSFSPHFDSAASSPYTLRLRVVDEGETTGDADDLFAELAVALVVQESAIPEIHVTPEGPFIINEGEILEFTVSVTNLSGSLREGEGVFGYISPAPGRALGYHGFFPFVSVSDITNETATVRLSPGFDAAALSPYRLQLQAIDHMRTPDIGDDQIVGLNIPFSVIDQDPPPLDIATDPSGPITMAEGEVLDVVVTFSEPIAYRRRNVHNNGYSISPYSSAFDTLDIVATELDVHNLSLRLAPQHGAAADGPYVLAINGRRSDGSVETLTVPITVTGSAVPFLSVSDSKPFVKKGTIRDVNVTTIGLTGSIREVLLSGDAAGFTTKTDTADGAILHIAPPSDAFGHISHGDDYIGEERDISVTVIDDMDTPTNVSDDVEITQTFIITVTSLVDIGTDRPLPIRMGEGEELDLRVTYGIDGFDLNGWGVADSSIAREIEEDSSHMLFHIAPGFDSAAFSPYKFGVFVHSHMGTLGDDSDDEASTMWVPIEVSERPTPPNELRVAPTDPIVLIENETSTITFTFHDPTGSVRGYGYDISPSSTEFNVFDIDVVGETDSSTTLQLTPREGASLDGPYELTLHVIDDMGSPIDPSNDRISTFTIPVQVIAGPIDVTGVVLSSGDLICAENLSVIATAHFQNIGSEDEANVTIRAASDSLGIDIAEDGIMVSEGNDAEREFTILIPEDASVGEHTVTITTYVDEVATDSENASLTIPECIIAPSPIDITLHDVELNPDRLSCSEGQNGASITVDLELENAASARVDDARILIRSNDLGVDITERDIEVDAGARESLRYTFSVPAGTAPGDYEIDVKSYLGSDVAAIEDLTLSVSACTSGSSDRTVSVSRDSGSSAPSFTPTPQTLSTTTGSSSTTQASSDSSAALAEESEEHSGEQSVPLTAVAPESSSHGLLDAITGRAVASGSGLSIMHGRSILISLVVIAGVLWVAVIILAGVVTVRMR